MQYYLNSFYPLDSKKLKHIMLFGYSSKGIPGIEIVGLGREGRILKEKLVYFIRYLKIQLPLKRFVLCIDDGPIPAGDFSYLELPLLLLLLNLMDAINIFYLENCITSGKILLNGKIKIFWSKNLKLEDRFTYLINQNVLESSYLPSKFILLESIFERSGIYFLTAA